MWTAVPIWAALVLLAPAPAAEPLPPGPYQEHCSACTATRVGQTGLLLGCLCDVGAEAPVVASTYLMGTGCPGGVALIDGTLSCTSFEVGPHVPPARVVTAPGHVTVMDTPKVAAPRPTPPRVPAAPQPVAAAPSPAAPPTRPPLVPPKPEAATPISPTPAYLDIRAHRDVVSYPQSCWLTREGALICTCPADPRPSDPIRLARNASGWDCACNDLGKVDCRAR